MSQFDWDYLEENKQAIIEGKIVYKLWDFEELKGINDTLTEEEMKGVFRQFERSELLLEIAHETLECIADEVVSEREKTTV